MSELIEDLKEELTGIDLMISGLNRQGIVDGPRMDLLKRRRVWTHERLREAVAYDTNRKRGCE